MNYYYDLLINFQSLLYEFYEWDEADDIIDVKKIPFFHVDTKVMLDFMKYEITISDDFFKMIKEKTIDKNAKENLSCFLLSDTYQSLVLEVNDDGKVIFLSKMLIEDENNINELAHTLEISNFDYQKGEKREILSDLRKTLKDKIIIKAELEKMKQNQDQEKCRYIYYEWFKEIGSDFENNILKMEHQLANESFETIHKIALLLKLTNKEKLI